MIPMNGLRIFKFEGKEVCVGRNQEGFHAIKNKCPHQGYSFSGGACSDSGKMVCPIHRYGFDLKTGRGAGSAVDVYSFETKEDGLYVVVSYVSIF
jgi:3-phenylpropionate/trans-cinnamate dioxygenase ferredoxin subunit